MTAAPATHPDEALLDELAGMLMSAARMAHARMQAAPDDAAFHAAGQTLHRMARSLRQTLALKQRSRREAEHAAREAQARADDRRIRQVIARRQAVKAAVERVWWNEHEPLDAEEADPALDEIHERAEAATLEADFLDLPIPLLVARICRAMGLPLPQPEAPQPDPPADDVPLRDSA